LPSLQTFRCFTASARPGGALLAPAGILKSDTSLTVSQTGEQASARTSARQLAKDFARMTFLKGYSEDKFISRELLLQISLSLIHNQIAMKL
jgi:hypothetical protein